MSYNGLRYPFTRYTLLHAAINELDTVISTLDELLEQLPTLIDYNFEPHYDYIIHQCRQIQTHIGWEPQDTHYHFLESSPKRILERLTTKLIRRRVRLDFRDVNKNNTTLIQAKFELEAVQYLIRKLISQLACHQTIPNPQST